MNIAFEDIKAGDRVTILVPAGLGLFGQEWKESTGRCVMNSSHGGYVLNMGGRYGVPGVCNHENFVKATRKNEDCVLSAVQNPQLH